MRLGIAGAVVELDCDDAVLERGLNRRYASYASDRQPDLSVHVVAGDDLTGVFADRARGHVRVEDSSPSTWKMMCPGAFEAVYDCRSAVGTVRLTHPRRHFDLFLQTLYSCLLGCSDGLLLHAACPFVDEVAVLIPGNNGSRRTGLSRQALSGIFADEYVAVRRRRDGVFVAYHTPFGQSTALRLGSGSAPVGGLYLLRHAAQADIRRVQPSSVLLEFLSYTVFFGPPSCTPSVTDRAAELVDRHLLGQFRCAPHTDATPLLRQDLASQSSQSAPA